MLRKEILKIILKCKRKKNSKGGNEEGGPSNDQNSICLNGRMMVFE